MIEDFQQPTETKAAAIEAGAGLREAGFRASP